MEKLEKRHLLNAGLVRLTPHLVERYNACLVSLGLAPTALTEIDIDGIGVSPQVALERNDPHYLCNGLANPLAIIVSPDQYDKPVYFPIYSWQRSLMRQLFSKNQKSIRDITGTHPIGIDIDNGLSTFEGPEDLPLLTELTAVPHIEDLAQAAREQADIITAFNDGPANDPCCLREDVCDALVTNRRAHGDLRKRRIDMRPVTFDGFDDFYTIAFDGAAVLRHVDGDDILVLENEEEFRKVNKRTLGPVRAYHLHEPEFTLFDVLQKNKWINVPLKRYRQNPKLLDFKKELLLADALCDCEEKLDWLTLTNAAHRAIMARHEDAVPAIYFELERFAAALKAGRALGLSPELEYFLAEPSEKMPPETQQVLWTLLTHREPRNLLALYTVDKNAFLARYQTWSDIKREWAADYLVKRYTYQHRISQ